MVSRTWGVRTPMPETPVAKSTKSLLGKLQKFFFNYQLSLEQLTLAPLVVGRVDRRHLTATTSPLRLTCTREREF